MSNEKKIQKMCLIIEQAMIQLSSNKHEYDRKIIECLGKHVYISWFRTILTLFNKYIYKQNIKYDIEYFESLNLFFDKFKIHFIEFTSKQYNQFSFSPRVLHVVTFYYNSVNFRDMIVKLCEQNNKLENFLKFSSNELSKYLYDDVVNNIMTYLLPSNDDIFNFEKIVNNVIEFRNN